MNVKEFKKELNLEKEKTINETLERIKKLRSMLASLELCLTADHPNFPIWMKDFQSEIDIINYFYQKFDLLKYFERKIIKK